MQWAVQRRRMRLVQSIKEGSPLSLFPLAGGKEEEELTAAAAAARTHITP